MKLHFKYISIITTIALTIVSCVAPTNGEELHGPHMETTEWLYRQCKQADDYPPSTSGVTAGSYCYGYLRGVANMMEMNGVVFQSLSLKLRFFAHKMVHKRATASTASIARHAAAALMTYGICPGPFNGDMLRQAFLSWAERNPTRWQRPMWDGVSAAFLEAWPCQVEDYPMIKLGVFDFSRELKSGGILGLKATVDQCWKAFRKKKSLEKAQYCFAVDYSTGLFQRAAEKEEHIRPVEGATIEDALNRAYVGLVALHFDQPSEVISKWEVSTRKAWAIVWPPKKSD